MTHSPVQLIEFEQVLTAWKRPVTAELAAAASGDQRQEEDKQDEMITMMRCWYLHEIGVQLRPSAPVWTRPIVCLAGRTFCRIARVYLSAVHVHHLCTCTCYSDRIHPASASAIMPTTWSANVTSRPPCIVTPLPVCVQIALTCVPGSCLCSFDHVPLYKFNLFITSRPCMIRPYVHRHDTIRGTILLRIESLDRRHTGRRWLRLTPRDNHWIHRSLRNHRNDSADTITVFSLYTVNGEPNCNRCSSSAVLRPVLLEVLLQRWLEFTMHITSDGCKPRRHTRTASWRNNDRNSHASPATHHWPWRCAVRSLNTLNFTWLLPRRTPVLPLLQSADQ